MLGPVYSCSCDDAGVGNYSQASLMSQCQRKCWRASPALFLSNYCFTFSKTTEDTLFIMTVRFNDVKMLPGRLLGLPRQCRRWITSIASLPWCHFAAVWSIFSQLPNYVLADRRRTPRTKWQKQRKSWRKSTRSSKSLEENCPTDFCSVMWGYVCSWISDLLISSLSNRRKQRLQPRW